MALDTYAGLKAAIADWSGYSDVTTQIPDFVSWAHQEIGRRLRANFMMASSTATISGETVAVPALFAAIRRFYLGDSPRVELVVTSPEGVMDIIAQHSIGTYPTHVTVEGASFRFAPRFSTSTTGTMLYFKKPVALVADADTNVVLAAYPYLYLYGALEALFSFKEDDNNADRYGQKFSALIEDINIREAADAMRGPLQTRSYAGGVI